MCLKQVGSFMIGLSSRSEGIMLFCDTLNPSLREGLSQIWYLFIIHFLFHNSSGHHARFCFFFKSWSCWRLLFLLKNVLVIVTQPKSSHSLHPPPTPAINNDRYLVMSFTGSIQAIVYPSIISAPQKPTKVFTGETVSFKWHYNSGDLKNDLFEVVFGIWKSPGFLKTKLIAVNSSGFASTRSSYKSSVGWAGNLTSSVAVFELYNVKLKDSKKYGIVVEYGLQHTPLTDTVQLQVSK